MASTKNLLHRLLDQYGQTFSDEIGIYLEQESPSVIFQWFFASNLFSARISSQLSMEAARALIGKGWTTAEKMRNTRWEQRVDVLHKAGYTHYQEKTATFLGDMSVKLVEEYSGDFRKLREKAGRNPDQVRALLKEFKGEGDVGVDIFFREIQIIWNELYPFADGKALNAAKKIGFEATPVALANMVDKKDFPRLVAALVRADLNHNYKLEKENEENQQHRAAETQAEQQVTRKALYKKAQEQGIQGRSTMSKEELAQAINHHL